MKNKDTPIYIYNAHNSTFSSNIVLGVKDLISGFSHYSIWLHLAWRDQKSATAHTYIGYSWSAITTIIQVLVLGFVYSSVLGQDTSELILYLAAGLSLWGFLAATFFSSFNLFVNYRTFVLSKDLPISILIYRYVFGDTIQLFSKLMSFVILSAVFMRIPTINILLFVPGMFLILLVSIPIRTICAIAGARYRDLQFAFQPFSLAAFLITPVLWERSRVGSKSWIAEFNPFTHLLGIVREPLLGKVPPMSSYVVVLGIAFIAWVLVIFTYSKYKNRIPMWM